MPQSEASKVYLTERGKAWAIPLQVTYVLFPNNYRSHQTTKCLLFDLD